MLLADERAEVVAVCRRLVAERLVVGTAGNVSVRVGDLVAVTPSGVDYATLTADQVGVHRLDGTPVQAPLAPTSEAPMHLACYTSRDAGASPDAGASRSAGAAGDSGAAGRTGAVVHTHSVAATALSCLVDEVPPVHYYLGMFGGRLRVAEYASYGTPQLAENMLGALGGGTGVLLANHGAVTLGDTLAAAYDRAVYLEYVCDVALRVLGTGRTPKLLDDAELAAVTARLSRYGQPRR